MKLTILQKNLKQGLIIVNHVVSKNINLPILNNIMFKINKGNIDAMYSLGSHYEKIHDHDNMKKYYGMAIDNGHDDAMYYLGSYYGDVEKDYLQMIKYYEMAIEKNNVISIFIFST